MSIEPHRRATAPSEPAGPPDRADEPHARDGRRDRRDLRHGPGDCRPRPSTRPRCGSGWRPGPRASSTLLLLTFQICVGLVLSPPDQQVDLEAIEADLPVARTRVGLRHGLPGGPHRQPDRGPVRRCRASPARSSRASLAYRSSPVALGTLALYAFLITAITAKLHEAPAAGRVALDPPAGARGLRPAPGCTACLAGTDSDALRPMYVATRPGRPRRPPPIATGRPGSGRPSFETTRHGGCRPMNTTSLPVRRSLTVARGHGRGPPRARRDPGGRRLDRGGGSAARSHRSPPRRLEARLAEEQARCRPSSRPNSSALTDDAGSLASALGDGPDSYRDGDADHAAELDAAPAATAKLASSRRPCEGSAAMPARPSNAATAPRPRRAARIRRRSTRRRRGRATMTTDARRPAPPRGAASAPRPAAYAISLAGVTALQSAADERGRCGRAPPVAADVGRRGSPTATTGSEADGWYAERHERYADAPPLGTDAHEPRRIDDARCQPGGATATPRPRRAGSPRGRCRAAVGAADACRARCDRRRARGRELSGTTGASGG